jgi:hypothetical protein
MFSVVKIVTMGCRRWPLAHKVSLRGGGGELLRMHHDSAPPS